MAGDEVVFTTPFGIDDGDGPVRVWKRGTVRVGTDVITYMAVPGLLGTTPPKGQIKLADVLDVRSEPESLEIDFVVRGSAETLVMQLEDVRIEEAAAVIKRRVEDHRRRTWESGR